MTGEHGRASYLVEGTDGKVYRYSRDKIEIAPVSKARSADTPPTETYAYSHIFGKAELSDIPGDQALIDLGEAMRTRPDNDVDDVCPHPDRCIPAGYTYLGQLIVHDITYLDVNMASNGRSPALDLDSVLPEKDPTPYMGGGSPKLGPLTIGSTSDGPPFPQDIPRQVEGPRGEPIIADPRNDNFLPLSQCHLLLLKFYNAIAQWLGIGWLTGQSAENARTIREMWVKHFQAAVLHDYLPRIVGRATHQAVMNHGRAFVHPKPFFTADRRPLDAGDVNWMPLEFAAALGRYGHSMIRNSYQPWNRLGATTTMTEFILNSYRNGDGLAWSGYALKMRWLLDWFELLDFSDTSLRHHAQRPIMANLIDTRLAKPLGHLPNKLLESPPNPLGEFNLAAQTLLRGRWCHLASAQCALEKLNCSLGKADAIRPLTDHEICDLSRNPESGAFSAHRELFVKTPLWFYMLREAEVQTGGRHLGSFVGRIVMETLHAAIDASEISILDGSGWTPTLPRAEPDRFTFADLVAFAGNPDPLGGPVTPTQQESENGETENMQ
ncbi:peroxidase family protein [Dongia sp. agr-C8]